MLSVNLFRTIGKSSIYPFLVLVSRNLELGLNHILRVAEQPTREAPDPTTQEQACKAYFLHRDALHIVGPKSFRNEIRGELGRIRWYLSENSADKPVPRTTEPFFPSHFDKAVNRTFIVCRC